MMFASPWLPSPYLQLAGATTPLGLAHRGHHVMVVVIVMVWEEVDGEDAAAPGWCSNLVPLVPGHCPSNLPQLLIPEGPLAIFPTSGLILRVDWKHWFTLNVDFSVIWLLLPPQ